MTRHGKTVILSLGFLLMALTAGRAAEDVPGLQRLCGDQTPLKAGMKIAFFGDSITMQGGFIETMRKAIDASPATKDLGVQLLQHGLNGGRAPTVLEGKSPWGDLGGSMSELLAKEKPDVVVIFVGVNDVWHGEKGTTPEDFAVGLKKMIDLGKASGAQVVVATLAVIGEKPDGSNPYDEKLDQYAEITFQTARKSEVVLVHLRQAFLAYLREHNQKDDQGRYRENQILTYDGVHLLPAGNDLVADQLARGIGAALKQ